MRTRNSARQNIKSTTLRIGSTAVLILIVSISMAVATVLCLSTAHSSYVVAEQQAKFVTATYANESAGQKFLQEVSDALANSPNSRASLTETFENSLPLGAILETNKITYTIVDTQTNRTLFIALSLSDDKTYSIVSWKSTSPWEEQSTGMPMRCN